MVECLPAVQALNCRGIVGPDSGCAERKRSDVRPGSDDPLAGRHLRSITSRGDSTIIRAHQTAAGAKALTAIASNRLPGNRGLKDKSLAAQIPLGDGNITCRAAGGFTTKIHLIANAHGLPMKAEISGGEVSDYKRFDLLRVDPLPAPKMFIADKGYDSNHIRDAIAAEGGTPVIPARANRKVLEPVDRITYTLRNHAERCFNKKKCSRRLAMRYNKTAESYLGFVQIVAVRIWVRKLST